MNSFLPGSQMTTSPLLNSSVTASMHQPSPPLWWITNLKCKNNIKYYYQAIIVMKIFTCKVSSVQKMKNKQFKIIKLIPQKLHLESQWSSSLQEVPLGRLQLSLNVLIIMLWIIILYSYGFLGCVSNPPPLM